MGDAIGSGLWSMAVCFDFRSANVVQLSKWNPYFSRTDGVNEEDPEPTVAGCFRSIPKHRSKL